MSAGCTYWLQSPVKNCLEQTSATIQKELKAATEEVLTTTALPLPPCRIYDYDDEGVEEDPDLANVLVVGGGEIRRLQKEVNKQTLFFLSMTVAYSDGHPTLYAVSP